MIFSKDTEALPSRVNTMLGYVAQQNNTKIITPTKVKIPVVK
jgi:hypothetical protein